MQNKFTYTDAQKTKIIERLEVLANDYYNGALIDASDIEQLYYLHSTVEEFFRETSIDELVEGLNSTAIGMHYSNSDSLKGLEKIISLESILQLSTFISRLNCRLSYININKS